MRKRFLAVFAAVCAAILLSGCSVRNKLDNLKDFLDPYLEGLFSEDDPDNSDKTNSGNDKNNSTDGFMVHDIFIPYSVEKLVISNRDSHTLSLLAGDIFPDGCGIITPPEDLSGPKLNLALIAENLPNLKELYLYQANAWNRESIAEMKNLEVLTYYVMDSAQTGGYIETYADCPFKELKNLRSLSLYGDYDDYSFLNEMPWLEEIHVESPSSNKSFKSLFGCGGVTSLDIDKPSSGYLDFEGLENLKKLKKLSISCSSLDFTAIGKLEELEDLYIRCTSDALNVSELSKASKLRKVSLSNLKTDDWGFLKQMNNLTDLSLLYIPNIKNSDLNSLKQLRSLNISESGCNAAVVKDLPNLEVYIEIMSAGGDFSVFKNCSKLRELTLQNFENVVMDFAYIQDCPLEVINCDGIEVTNVELLANVKTLKSIFIANDKQDITCTDMLKKALPNCEISINDIYF